MPGWLGGRVWKKESSRVVNGDWARAGVERVVIQKRKVTRVVRRCIFIRLILFF